MKFLSAHFLLLLVFFSVSGQNTRETILNELEGSPKNSVDKPGYYLLEGEPPSGVEIIQTKSANLNIIFARPGIPLNQPLYQINNHWKLAAGLQPDETKGAFVITFKDQTGMLGFQSIYKNSPALSRNSLLVRNVKLEELINFQEIVFINKYYEPKEESLLSYSNRALNRAMAFQTLFPDIRGASQVISIKERGYDVKDPDIRGRSIYEWPEIGTSSHATDMATIAAGSGLIAEGSTGTAPEARLKQASFNSLFAENDSYYAGVTAQNHSYGTRPEPFYGPEAASYDASVLANPRLAHVFSIGNAGLQSVDTGPYSGVTGFNTLTGNFKNAKNVITVSSSDAQGNTILQNSKGPTFDGRVKPELVAYGEGGTSDAAALVSGAIASLSELYHNRFQEQPEFALTKAILLAGADDLGYSGPDYSTGFGQMNMANSAGIITNETFATVSSGQKMLINIPQGTARFRLVLSWLDPPSMPGDEILLKNDLNLVISDPDGNDIFPWILSSYPHPDSLNSPAKRGIDHLNTQEIITLQNPAQGVYEVNITGPENGIPAFIAWQLEEMNSFEWRYPLSGTSVESSSKVTVYWDTSMSGIVQLEWSADGIRWNNIGATLVENEQYQFTAPDTSAVIRLRVSLPDSKLESMPFTVSPQLEPTVDFVCSEQWQISWKPVNNATDYIVMGRRDDSLWPIAVETGTLFNSTFSDYQDSLISVQAFIGEYPAQRSLMFNIYQQGVKCYFAGFTGVVQTTGIDFTLRIGTTKGINRIRTFRLGDNKIIYDSTTPLPISEFTDHAPLTGTNKYQTILSLDNGKSVSSEIIEFIYAPAGYALVYPNPILSGSSLNIYSTDPDIYFELYTLQGSLITRVPLTTALEQVPVPVSEGLYIYRISGNRNVKISGKLVVY